MSTPWKNSSRIAVRKRLKAAGLAGDVKISNKEDILEGDEVGYVVAKGATFLPFVKIEAALAGSMYCCVNINDDTAVIKLRKRDRLEEKKGSVDG